jgi:hypothetical protein
MEAAYYILSTLMVLLLFALPILFIIFLAKPELLNRYLPRPFSRSKIVLAGIISALVIFFGFGTALAITEPESIKQQRIAEQRKKEAAEPEERLRKLEAEKPKVKIETQKEVIPFESTERENGSIPRGERRLATNGVNGERTITYEVTYVNGKETKRTEIKREITKSAITKVTLVGIYVKPVAPAPAPSGGGGGGDGYVNSRGNYVPSPSSSPAGATAQCSDGTYSYSQSRRGTCSHHGGVAVWF